VNENDAKKPVRPEQLTWLAAPDAAREAGSRVTRISGQDPVGPNCLAAVSGGQVGEATLAEAGSLQLTRVWDAHPNLILLHRHRLTILFTAQAGAGGSMGPGWLAIHEHAPLALILPLIMVLGILSVSLIIAAGLLLYTCFPLPSIAPILHSLSLGPGGIKTAWETSESALEWNAVNACVWRRATRTLRLETGHGPPCVINLCAYSMSDREAIVDSIFGFLALEGPSNVGERRRTNWRRIQSPNPQTARLPPGITRALASREDNRSPRQENQGPSRAIGRREGRWGPKTR
jgi:hypothetical protein